MQLYIDKYCQLLKQMDAEKQDTVAAEIYFCMNSVKRFQELTKDNNLTEESLHVDTFLEVSSQIIMKNAQFMNPSRLLGVLNSFNEVRDNKTALVKSIL